MSSSIGIHKMSPSSELLSIKTATISLLFKPRAGKIEIARKHLVHHPGIVTEVENALFVRPEGDSGDDRSAWGQPGKALAEEGIPLAPFGEDTLEIAFFKAREGRLQPGEDGGQQRAPCIMFSRVGQKGGGFALQLPGESIKRGSNVDTDAEHRKGAVVGKRLSFGEDSAELSAGEQQVIGPLDGRRHAGFYFDGLADGEPCGQGDLGEIRRRQPGPEDEREIETSFRWRQPCPAKSAPAAALSFGHDQSALDRTLASEG
jgi:hypothetical protein